MKEWRFMMTECKWKLLCDEGGFATFLFELPDGSVVMKVGVSLCHLPGCSMKEFFPETEVENEIDNN